MGADDNRVLAKMNLKLKIDEQKLLESTFEFDKEMFGFDPADAPEFPEIYVTESIDMTYGADFEKRFLEMSLINESTVTGTVNEHLKMNGKVLVSDKAGDRYVSKDMTMTKTMDGESHTIRYATTAKLEENNSISNIGTITLDGEAVKYNFTIKKDELGNCEVKTDFGENIVKVVEAFEGEETKEEYSPKN